MIINGGSRSNWRFFAQHLVKTEENEFVRVADMRGLAAETVREAFREMSAMASATRCKNFFYHANLNPRADETLTDAQWEQAVDLLEEKLGLVGHSRFVVEHRKEGRSHRHVVWSRIDNDTLTATSDSMNFAVHEEVARSLEAKFGHGGVVGAHGRTGRRPPRRAKSWETFRGHDSGIDPAELTREVTRLWQQTDSGKAFAAALEAQGMRLCRGARRDYCVLDASGDVHSLARRIDGAKAAQIRARLEDLDPQTVPTIEQAKALQTEEPPPADAASPVQPAMPLPVSSALDQFAGQVQATMRAQEGDPHFADGLTWLERSITVLQQIGDGVVDWVRGRWEDLVDRLAPGTRDHDDDIER